MFGFFACVNKLNGSLIINYFATGDPGSNLNWFGIFSVPCYGCPGWIRKLLATSMGIDHWPHCKQVLNKFGNYDMISSLVRLWYTQVSKVMHLNCNMLHRLSCILHTDNIPSAILSTFTSCFSKIWGIINKCMWNSRCFTYPKAKYTATLNSLREHRLGYSSEFFVSEKRVERIPPSSNPYRNESKCDGMEILVIVKKILVFYHLIK